MEDDGYPRGLTPQELEVSHTTLKAMAVAVNATIQPLKEMTACKGRVYVIFRISRICLDHLSYTDLRIAGGHPAEAFELMHFSPCLDVSKLVLVSFQSRERCASH